MVMSAVGSEIERPWTIGRRDMYGPRSVKVSRLAARYFSLWTLEVRWPRFLLMQKKMRPPTRSPPNAKPGTKPAAKDVPENAFGPSTRLAKLLVTGTTSILDAVPEPVADGASELVDEIELDAGISAGCAVHSDPWQVYPIGQHASPHVARGAVGLEWS
jgi:hypothetical protein